jgi:hypothetical protein
MEIFVSYAWKGESEMMVEALCQALAERGHTVARDRTKMSYRDSIRDFMDRIGRGKYIIAVVSDRYMKSEYCMYEAYRMFQSAEFSRRVFPIVLPDADIFSFQGQAAYLKHWQAAYEELETAYRQVADTSPTMAAPLTARLRDIEVTTRFIGDFMAAITDMNVLSGELHLESGFEALIAAIEARMTDGPAETDHPQPGQAPVRVETGGGVYIGGNVDTGGGDFVAGDKIVQAGSAWTPERAFEAVHTAIDSQPQLSAAERADLAAEARELVQELKKGEAADSNLLNRKLRGIRRLSPQILERVLEILSDPAAGFASAARNAALAMRRGAQE